MIGKIDHIGIAVEQLDEALEFWEKALGLKLRGIETVEAEKVRVAMLDARPSTLELLEPTTGDSTIATHLAKRGKGIHHLTLAVEDIRAVLDRLESRDVRIVGEAPRIGAGGRKVAFVHPASTGGVLLELVEERSEAGGGESSIEPGSCVLVYLRDPSEKMWGVLRRLDPSGVVVEGVDLSSFDDWVAQIERDEETIVGPSVLFLPMSRVDKVLLDRSSGPLPSMAERFRARIGRTVQEVLAESSAQG
jgi:methylmalonyl-CoA epimerase